MMSLQQIRLPNGIDLAFVDRPGKGATVLLLHGFPLSHAMWNETIEQLGPDFRIIAPDLRGHGASEVTDGVVTMADMADDVAWLLDALGSTQPITLVGLSMGGYVAWEFWRRHRHRLARWALCDTRAVADTVEVSRGREMMATKVLQEGAAAAAQAMLPKFFTDSERLRWPDKVARIEQLILNTPPAGIAAAQRGMAIRADFTAELPQMNLPSLIICGDHDRISPPEEMRGIAAAMPQAEYRQIPHAGHLPPIEAPQAFVQTLRPFLSQTT